MNTYMRFRHLLFAVLCMVQIDLFGMQSAAIQHEVSPTTIEFAYDMHETLVTRNLRVMIGLSWYYGARKAATLPFMLMYDYLRYMFDGRVRPAHKFVSNIYGLITNKTGTTLEIYKPMLEAYDPRLGILATKIAASYDAMPGMKELVQELAELGYTQRIATNGGPADYQFLAAKHAHTFGCFAEGLTVSVDKPELRKPNIEYFCHYHERFNNDHTKTIIFIDDKQKNVDVANGAGMHGILFTSAQQLRKDLKKLGILLN